MVAAAVGAVRAVQWSSWLHSEGCAVWLCRCQHSEMGKSWILTDWAINNGLSMQESFYQGGGVQSIPFVLPQLTAEGQCPRSPVTPGQPAVSPGSLAPLRHFWMELWVCAQHCPPAWLLLRSACWCHLQVPGPLFSRRDSSSFLFLCAASPAVKTAGKLTFSHLCTWSSQECSHQYAMGQPPVLIGTANCISPVFHQLYCIKARQPTASSLASQTSWNPCAQHQRAEHYRQQKNPVGISSLLGCTTLPSNFCFFKYLWVAHILGSKVNGGTPQRTAFRDQGELCWKSTSTAEPIEKDIQPAGLDAWRKGRQSWSSHGGSIVWIPGSVILLQLPTALPSEGPAFFPAHSGAHLITAF